MYRHLLVPLDDSALATELVSQSVRARRGARREGHVLPRAGRLRLDAALAALERVMWPALLQRRRGGRRARRPREGRRRGARGRRRVRVARRRRATGRTRRSCRPREARGCDLIVMASHGRRGMRGLVLGSQTQNVLQQREPPGAGPGGAEQPRPTGRRSRPLAILRDEHRSHRRRRPRPRASWSRGRARRDSHRGSTCCGRSCTTSSAFPETLHHPKEDAYLFRKLRERTIGVQRHAGGARAPAPRGPASWSTNLERSLARYEADPAGGLAQFAAAVERDSSRRRGST